MMKEKAPLLWFALWLFLSFAPVCLPAEINSKAWHYRDTQRLWNESGTKKLCDPAVSDQTAGAVPECTPGFYREQTGPSKGRCVPCRCNGLSDLCDAQTGNCMNCRFDAAGDRCERCREGFYGHAANRTCRACPCPSTHNNFAVACLDVSPGVVECLCKRGYRGARCERCASGYHGNPMVLGDVCKPCNCTDSSLSVCDSLTGECAAGASSSGDDPCHKSDGCARGLLADLEKVDGGLVLLRQLVLNITAGLSLPEADASQTKLHWVDGESGAGRWLEPDVEQLEADIDLVGKDLTHQDSEMPDITLGFEKALKNANKTIIQVQDLLFKAVALVQAANGLAERQTSPKPDVSSSLSDGQRSQTMEEAEQIVAEIKGRRCRRAGADGEQEGARMLLEHIRAHMSDLSQTVQDVLKRTADVLTASNVPVAAAAEQLSSVQETVEKTHRFNLEGASGLENLQTALAALRRERTTVPPAMERIYVTMKKTKDALFVSQKMKNEVEDLAAQVDGGEPGLFGKLNATWKCVTQTEAVTRAEGHAEELSAAASQLQQALQNAASSRELLRIFGADDSVAWLSQAANQALRDVEEGGLIISAERMEDLSADLHAEANDTRRRFKTVSRALNAQRDSVKKQEKKAEMLKASVLSLGGSIKQIERGDTKDLMEFVRITTSAVNAKVSKVKERLGNISLEVRRIPSARFSGNFLTDANRAVERLNAALPVLEDKLEQIEALGEDTSPSAEVTESIQRIKDVIDEARSFVNRLPLAATFSGKSHIELHPPRNLEDIKAFTAVDLLLNLHRGEPMAARARRRRRRRRRHKRRDENSHFVLYLGTRDTLGDYFAMVIRDTKLICLYKLGGVAHEMETSQISTGNINSSCFDRIVFQRVYQDAAVGVTKNFTSQKPVSLPRRQNLPDTASSVMSLDAQRAVFYVGGYPEEFNPPEELRYPKFRGAMKLSYINDIPVNLFNYRRAVNMQAKQSTAKIPQAELCDYYDGTGYRMAFLKEPQKKKRQLFRFNTSSRETNALLFYIGNEESFFCIRVERGFLVLEGQQGGRQLRNQSSAPVSLFEKKFAVVIGDRFVVRYGSEQIHTDHLQTDYMWWYMGGLPAWLRRRHNITAAPLRGCVDDVTADGEFVVYNKTVGVGGGCPLSLLGVRAAAVHSTLPADSLFVCSGQSRVSLGFSSTSRHAVLLNCGSQSFTSGHDLQLSLADGFIIFRGYNYTLTSGKRYNDGAWHYLSAEWRPTGLGLTIDNVNAVQKQAPPVTRQDEQFKGCIANLYTRRDDSKFIPADLSPLSHAGDVFPGWCSLKFQSLAGARCSHQQAQYEHQFSEASWLSYTFPEEELNYRPHFSLHIKTKSSKGLILHAAGSGVVPRLALYMANGKIRMSLGQNRVIQHKKKSNDGGWHMVEFSVENSTFHLLVDGVRVPDGQLPGNEGSSLRLRNPVYLGGHPKKTSTKGHDIPAGSVIGCLRDFKMNNVAAPAPDSSREILPCLGGLTETGTFFGGGHVLPDNFFTDGSQFVLSFEMRPQHLTGLLFHFRSDATSSLNVYLMENRVGVWLVDASGPVSVTVAPGESLCDGKFHAVTVSKQRSVIALVVDSESRQKTYSSRSGTFPTLYIGGTTHQHGAPVSSPFVGCLRRLKINGKPLRLETGSQVVGVVSMNTCPAG